MPLGWIDYSKSERNKILSILDMLSEPGTLDEIGIAPIRDGFANLFFPGTSTIQTRAKYFLIVPYIFKDIELSKESAYGKVSSLASNKERQTAEYLLQKEKDQTGIIGQRSLNQGSWVKRPPSEIYWAGMRRYDIFRGGGMTISEYLRSMCFLKNNKTISEKMGNRNDNKEEEDGDDKNANNLYYHQFWNIPTYKTDWLDDLNMKLTISEGKFLKKQIISTCQNTLLEYILSNNRNDILNAKSFEDLHSLLNSFPEEIKNDYWLAYDFSYFTFVLRVVFNIIVSNGKNEEANRYWEELKPQLKEIANIDIDKIFKRLELFNNPKLKLFLQKCQTNLLSDDIEALKKNITAREVDLKGTNRAKTAHPGEFKQDEWFCGYGLDYRFNDAKTIITDIFESEGLC